MRDMKWNADGQRICIVYEDGKYIQPIFSYFFKKFLFSLFFRVLLINR